MAWRTRVPTSTTCRTAAKAREQRLAKTARGFIEPAARRLEAAGQDRERPRRPAGVDPGPGPLRGPRDRPPPPLEGAPQRRVELRQHRNDDLGRVRRRGRPHVGDLVRERRVGLVADRGDDGDRRSEDRARDRLLVEGPEVLDAAAAPARDHQLDLATQPGAPDALRDVQRGAVALDADGHEDQVRAREAVEDDLQEVVDRGAVRRRHERDAAREERQRPLARGVEDAFRRELRPKRAQHRFARSDARGLHPRHDDLVAAILGVDRDAPGDAHLEALGRREREHPRARVPHDRVDPARRVLKGEVEVPGRRALDLADRALRP